MNQERNEGVKSGQTDISPLAKLEEAITEYLASLGEDRTGANGVLTGWLLVTEEQNICEGTSSLTRVIKDHQTTSTTLGLATYLDKFYSARVAGSQ